MPRRYSWSRRSVCNCPIMILEREPVATQWNMVPQTSRALAAGEMVRVAVQDLGMPHATSVYQSVTVSVGIACTTPSDAQAPKDLIEAADAALYAAKHRGRNAVVEHGLVRVGDAADAMK